MPSSCSMAPDEDTCVTVLDALQIDAATGESRAATDVFQLAATP
ncbi:MAG: hypothetical protein U5K76_04970 [Woeseiaceae bacterium]|nr:hypothetical protein [Woeseiaceae bacterium]